MLDTVFKSFYGIYKYHRNSLISEDREEYMNCLFRIIGLWESLLFIILYLNTNLFFSDPFSLKTTCKIPHHLHNSEDHQLKNVE